MIPKIDKIRDKMIIIGAFHLKLLIGLVLDKIQDHWPNQQFNSVGEKVQTLVKYMYAHKT
jgi:hypothetical protein